MQTTFARLLCSAALLTISNMALAAAETPKPADEDKIAEGSTIVVTATKVNELTPVTASLQTTQPQAIVSRSFIQDSLPTTADFNTIALISPSVSNFNGVNGVGLSESKSVIRGFQDGEYNITYDGVPFGDTNDPTHHSNTFFPSNTIETVIVDRGPGNASQLGQATFGGNINLFSRAAREERGVELLGSYGSFNTYVGQALVQTGDIVGHVRSVLSAQYVKTDGRLSYSPYEQLNVYGKVVIPIGPDVELSLLGTKNRNVFNQADNNGATLAQVAQFGINYALNNDRNTPQYFGYNRTVKTSDFFAVRLTANVAAGLKLDNTAYSYFYDNQTLSAADVTGGTANTVVLADGKTKVFGIPGYDKVNRYRVNGDILKATVDFRFGSLLIGGQIEWNDTFRQQSDFNLIDMSRDYREKAVTAPNIATALNPGAVTPLFIRFNQNSSLNHTELFSELELRPINGLRVTPGIKYVDFNRKIDATYNQTTRYAQRLSKTYTATLPFLTVNYQVTPQIAVYAQYARGFLMPPLSQLYVADPSLSTVDPQKSTNYQAGAVYHGRHLSLDADIYSIEFTNKFLATGSGLTAGFTNIGGALYQGVEGQAAYAFDFGLAIFANGSYNRAISTTSRNQIPRAPYMTAAAGVIYKHGPIRFSLIDKLTGPQYSVASAALGVPNPAAYRLAPYNTAVLAASYDFGIVRAGLKVSDLFDSQKVTSISTGSAPAFDQYSFQPGRQITGEVTVKF